METFRMIPMKRSPKTLKILKKKTRKFKKSHSHILIIISLILYGRPRISDWRSLNGFYNILWLSGPVQPWPPKKGRNFLSIRSKRKIYRPTLNTDYTIWAIEISQLCHRLIQKNKINSAEFNFLWKYFINNVHKKCKWPTHYKNEHIKKECWLKQPPPYKTLLASIWQALRKEGLVIFLPANFKGCVVKWKSQNVFNGIEVVHLRDQLRDIRPKKDTVDYWGDTTTDRNSHPPRDTHTDIETDSQTQTRTHRLTYRKQSGIMSLLTIHTSFAEC